MKKLIKLVYGDILQIYKNFLHFTLSKILIFISVFILIIGLSIPILILILLVLYFSGLLNSFFAMSFDILATNPVYLIILAILFILLLIVLSLWYSYKSVLLFKLNLTYTTWKKLDYKKNFYFNFSMIYNYAKIFLLNLAILLIPVVLYIILFFVFIFLFGWAQQVNEMVNIWASNSFSLSLLIVTISCFIWFIYLVYKTLFSYIIFVDESKWKNFKNAFYYIKKSFLFTKWFNKALKFIVVAILTGLASLIIYIPESLIANNLEKKSDYINMKSWNAQSMLESNPYYFQSLELEYSGISLEDLQKNISLETKIVFLFSILEFLLITWLFNMMLTSFYKRELKLSESKISSVINKITKKDKEL